MASVIATGQKCDLTMLMYYDAQPWVIWNGMFDFRCEPLKGYYPFYFFNKLYEMGEETESVVEGEKLYVVSAAGNGKKGFFITAYNDDDAVTDKVTFKAEIAGLSGTNKASFYLLDETHNGELVREEVTSAEVYTTFLTVEKHTLLYIEIENV